MPWTSTSSGTIEVLLFTSGIIEALLFTRLLNEHSGDCRLLSSPVASNFNIFHLMSYIHTCMTLRSLGCRPSPATRGKTSAIIGRICDLTISFLTPPSEGSSPKHNLRQSSPLCIPYEAPHHQLPPTHRYTDRQTNGQTEGEKRSRSDGQGETNAWPRVKWLYDFCLWNVHALRTSKQCYATTHSRFYILKPTLRQYIDNGKVYYGARQCNRKRKLIV